MLEPREIEQQLLPLRDLMLNALSADDKLLCHFIVRLDALEYHSIANAFRMHGAEYLSLFDRVAGKSDMHLCFLDALTECQKQSK